MVMLSGEVCITEGKTVLGLPEGPLPYFCSPAVRMMEPASRPVPAARGLDTMLLAGGKKNHMRVTANAFG